MSESLATCYSKESALEPFVPESGQIAIDIGCNDGTLLGLRRQSSRVCQRRGKVS